MFKKMSLYRIFLAIIMLSVATEIRPLSLVQEGLLLLLAGGMTGVAIELYRMQSGSNQASPEKHNYNDKEKFEALEARCLNAKNENIEPNQRTDYLNYVKSYSNHENPLLAKRNNNAWYQAVLSCMNGKNHEDQKEENASNLMRCFYAADDFVEKNKK